MSASIDKKIQVLFYLILRSAPKQVVQAQRAARCKPRRIHDSHQKKQHRDFSKEVDSLGVGQFSNIQQNAALCSAMLSKVHNGAVAIRNGANGCFATVLHPLSFAQKKKASEFRCFLFWWEEVDSNHRRRCQQIYSLLPLATREPLHILLYFD